MHVLREMRQLYVRAALEDSSLPLVEDFVRVNKGRLRDLPSDAQLNGFRQIALRTTIAGRIGTLEQALRRKVEKKTLRDKWSTKVTDTLSTPYQKDVEFYKFIQHVLGEVKNLSSSTEPSILNRFSIRDLEDNFRGTLEATENPTFQEAARKETVISFDENFKAQLALRFVDELTSRILLAREKAVDLKGLL